MGIYRRKNTDHWWADITIRGRRVRESTGTADRAAALEWHDRRRTELWRQAEFGERPTYCWEDACLKWLDEMQHKRDYAADKQRLRLLHPDLAGLALADVTHDRLNKVLAKHPQLKTPAARNRYRATVRAILRKAEREWDLIERAPIIRMEREPASIGRWITAEEAGRLIAVAPEHLQPVIRFALATGLRKSNILGLRWQNIDLEHRQLWVHPDDAKAGRAIGIPLNQSAMQVLLACRGRHTEFVFTVDGRPYRWIDHRTWQHACSNAGLSGLRFHDLRHTWASWLAQAGVDPQHLRTLGGWSSMAMVERYSHLNVEHLRPAVDLLPDLGTNRAQSDVVSLAQRRQSQGK